MDRKKIIRRIIEYLWKFATDSQIKQIAELLGVKTDEPQERKEEK